MHGAQPTLDDEDEPLEHQALLALHRDFTRCVGISTDEPYFQPLEDALLLICEQLPLSEIPDDTLMQERCERVRVLLDLPTTCQVIGCHVDYYRNVILVAVVSADFPRTRHGYMLPQLRCTYEQTTTVDDEDVERTALKLRALRVEEQIWLDGNPWLLPQLVGADHPVPDSLLAFTLAHARQYSLKQVILLAIRERRDLFDQLPDDNIACAAAISAVREHYLYERSKRRLA